MPGISAVIITHNEEKHIRRCLDSLKGIADEIIVLDSFSTDGTRQICETYPGLRFQTQEWLGFAATKNVGNSLATQPWILSLDADEALSEALQNSILQAKSNLQGACSFNRLNHYCGHPVKKCGWYPDRKACLFPKGKANWEGEVHEALKLEDGTPVQHLSGDLLHFTYDSISDHVHRADHYSSLAAGEIVAAGEGGLVLKMIFSPGWKFFSKWILKGGILAGFYGGMISAISGYEVFLKYAKAIQKRRQKRGRP